MNILKLQADAAKLPFDGSAPYYQHYSKQHPPEDLNTPEVTQDEADVRDGKDPGFFSEVLPAAFGDSNLSTGMWRSLGVSHPIDPSYNHRESLKELTKGIPPEYHDEFHGLSREDDEHTLAVVKNKIAEQQVLQEAHGMSYLTAAGLSMFVDPVGVGMFGAEAKLLAGALSKGKRVGNMLRAGASSAATMELYGAALAETHGSTLDGKDVLYLAAGGLAGGALSGAFAKGASKSSVKMNEKMHEAAKGMQRSMDEELMNSVNVMHEPMSYAEAVARAGEELLSTTHSELAAVAGNRLDRGAVKNLRKEVQDLQTQRNALGVVPDSVDVSSQSYQLTLEAVLSGSNKPLRKTAEKAALKKEQAILATRKAEYTAAKATIDTQIKNAQVKLGKHELASTAEADLSRFEQGILPDAHIAAVQARAQEILQQNADSIAKPKQKVTPVAELDAKDTSLGMFERARLNIAASWNKAAKGDGSTAGMFIPFEGGAKPKLKGQYSDLTDRMQKVELTDRNNVVNTNIIRLGHTGERSGKPVNSQTTTLGELFEHPELYKEFPELKNMEVVLRYEKSSRGNGGVYIAAQPEYGAPERIVIHGVKDNLRFHDLDKVLRHEVQHAIQERAGFGAGGSVARDGERYKYLAGEEEARRAEMGAYKAQGKNGDPYRDTDIRDASKLISRNTDGTPMEMFVQTDNGLERVAPEAASPESVLAEFTKREGESASLEYFARAKALEASGVLKGLDDTFVGQAQTKLGRFALSDSSAAYSFKAPEAKLFAFDHLENATGVVLNPGSTAIKKEAIQTRLLSIAQPEFPKFERAWREENGKLGIKDILNPGWSDDMNRELRIEMELRTNAHAKGEAHVSPHSSSTQKMADKLDDANAAALKERKLSGEHGAQEVVPRPGYVQLLWDGRLMQEFDKVAGLTKKFQQVYSESVQEVTGIPKKVADKISKQVWLRAMVNDLGMDANPHALLSKDSREYFRAMLENSGELSTDEINGMLAQIDATMSDAGASSRMKRRTGVDLLKSFEYEGKEYQLLDVVDNDMQRLHMRYVGEASGRSALAAKGIASEANWTAQRSAILEGMGKAGDSHDDIVHMKDIIAATHEQLLSRPVGAGVNRNARRVMDWTGASLLAQAGSPQIAEFGQILGEHGVGNMWDILPAVKQFRNSLKDGSIPGGVIADIAPWTGRIYEEHLLFPQNVRLAERSGSDAKWLQRLDRLTASAKELSGYISGMYWIKSLQQQMTVALQSQKMAEYLRGIKFTEAGYVATGKFAGEELRLKSIGWDTEFFRAMKEVEHNFEWEDGIIQRLNMHKWNNPQLVNTFVEGIHKHTSNIIQKPHIGNTAVWMHSTVGSVLTQFRTYPIVGLEKQTLRHLHLGDRVALMTGMYGLGMSSLVSSAKAYLASVGKPEDERKKYLDTRLSSAGLFRGAMAYSSITSLAPDLLNVVAPFVPGMQNLVSTQATRAGGSRGINPSMKDIPSVGTVINAANAVGGLVRNTLDPSYRYSKQDARAVRSITPLGTAHGAVQFFNAIEQGMVEK